MVGDAGQAEGQWRGKALLHNLQNGKSGTVSLDIIAQEPSRMRMEVTGMMGVYVASFALQDGQVQYILAQQKKFVTAPSDASALRDLVLIRIKPRDLVRVLFDRPLNAANDSVGANGSSKKKEWDCKMDAAHLPIFCVHPEEGVRVTWLERNGGHRKLKIESSTAEATLVLDQSRSKVEAKSDVYTLAAPAGYRQEIHQ